MTNFDRHESHDCQATKIWGWPCSINHTKTVMKKIADFIVKHERKIAVVAMFGYGVFIFGISFRWQWIRNPFQPVLPWLPPEVPVPIAVS